MLTFATPDDRLKAEQLMQPTLIRVIDNLRKHIETTSWQSEYVERVLWPDSATDAEKQQVKAIAAELETAPPEKAQQLRQQLDSLPTPIPAYQLHITHDGETSVLDIWQLCFQVCFSNYRQQSPAQIDTDLLDGGDDIDWIALDEKARARVDTTLQQITGAKTDSF